MGCGLRYIRRAGQAGSEEEKPKSPTYTVTVQRKKQSKKAKSPILKDQESSAQGYKTFGDLESLYDVKYPLLVRSDTHRMLQNTIVRERTIQLAGTEYHAIRNIGQILTFWQAKSIDYTVSCSSKSAPGNAASSAAELVIVEYEMVY